VGASYAEDNPFDIRVPANRSWFLDRCRELVATTGPAFAFATEDSRRLSEVQEYDDPRRNVWPTTYYGPALSMLIGRERLRTAPAWKVEEAPDGGTWLFVEEAPFAWGTAADERARTIERHLRLAEVFVYSSADVTRARRADRLGAPTDPLRPTGRVGADGPGTNGTPAKVRRVMLLVVFALLLLPLLWVGTLLLLKALG
jgi:hypothetical protein